MSESKEIAVRATPETLAEMAITGGSTGIHLRWAKGLHCATVRDDAVSQWDMDASPLGVMRAWLVEQIRNAYDAGHAAGLSDLSKITVPTGTPLDEVADLRREVERLKADAATAAKVKETDEAWVRTETIAHVMCLLGLPDDTANDEAAFRAIDAFGKTKRAAADRLTRERDDARLDADRLTTEVTRLRKAVEGDKSPGSSYFSGFLEARLRVREYLENREARLASAKKESERLREESANAASRVMALTYECTALDEALDAIGEEPA